MLRVVTFNIQHAAKGDYGRGYPDLLAEACQAVDADILGLQEVDVGVPRSGRANLAAVAAEATGMNFVFGKARTFRGRGQFGNALLVRGEIRDVDIVKLQGDYHRVKLGKHALKLVPEPRNAVIANVNVNGHELAVGVTHLGGDTRKEQLGHAAAALACRSLPRILLGDMNLHWAQARDCAAPYDLQLLKGPNTSEAWNPRQQIDHIALHGLRALDIYTLPRLPVSDHLMLVAEVEVLNS